MKYFIVDFRWKQNISKDSKVAGSRTMHISTAQSYLKKSFWVKGGLVVCGIQFESASSEEGKGGNGW